MEPAEPQRLPAPARVRPGRRPTSAPPPSPTTARNLWVVSGVRDYVVLKTTDSEFFGYLQERYTTCSPPTTG